MHELKCDGAHSKQCPRCWKEFPNEAGKSRHRAKGTCPILPKPVALPPPLPMPDEDAPSTSSSTSTPDYTAITSFDKTSTQSIIAHVQGHPEAQTRLRAAFACGCLHEELTRLTHFFGPEDARNILNVDGRGCLMKIVYNGKPICIETSEGLAKITSRNIEMSNDPIMKAVLGIDELGDVLTVAMTARQRAYENRRIKLVIMNGGEYMMIDRCEQPLPERPGRIQWSTRVRNLVAAQQGWQCNVCNELFQYTFDLDHVTPLFKGGADAICNLQALCVYCHRDKTATERTRTTF